MELRQLKYFLTVADARSFVGAANELFVSRQAISKAISQLEGELNVDLFFRSPSGAFLTPAGVVFYDRVRSSIIELEKAQQELQLSGRHYMQNVHAVFAVGTLRLYEDALLRCRSERRNINIRYSELTEAECLHALTEHQAEIAVCPTRVADPSMICDEVCSSPFGVMMRAGAENDGEAVDAGDLKWLPLAGMSDPQTARLCEDHALTLSYTGYDCYRLFELTAQGRCAMLLPRALMPQGYSGVVWLPLESGEKWQLYRLQLHSLESNILYKTVLDEFTADVFGR